MKRERIARWGALGALLAALGAAPVWAAPPDAGPTLEPAARERLAHELLRQLQRRYVYPERIPDVAARLHSAAIEVEQAGALAERMTALLVETIHDQHLRVEFAPGPRPSAAEDLDAARYGALGIARVERLRGNVGLLELRGFLPVKQGGAALAAAMRLLAHTDALIIDLRRNGGGEPEMVQHLAGYFFDRPARLTDIQWRAGNRLEKHWSASSVPGPRYGQRRPVYVLTERNTFSAAEGFAYALQARGRATVVGETTGGGAHPGDEFRLGPQFVAFIPTGRSVDPMTGGNWEGRGVAPDHAVAAADALNVAHRLAIERLLPAEAHPHKKGALQRALATLPAPAAPAPQ